MPVTPNSVTNKSEFDESKSGLEIKMHPTQISDNESKPIKRSAKDMISSYSSTAQRPNIDDSKLLNPDEKKNVVDCLRYLLNTLVNLTAFEKSRDVLECN